MLQLEIIVGAVDEDIDLRATEGTADLLGEGRKERVLQVGYEESDRVTAPLPESPAKQIGGVSKVAGSGLHALAAGFVS